MLEIGLFLAFEFGDDALGKFLPQLDSPLIERINLPDGALSENADPPKSNDTPIDTWFSGGGITSKGEQDKPYRSRRLNGRPAETRTPDLYRRNVDPHLIGMLGSRDKTASQGGRANPHGTNRLSGRPGRTRTVGLYRVNAPWLGFTTTYKSAGTAKVRGSRTRHRILWVGLWVGNRP